MARFRMVRKKRKLVWLDGVTDPENGTWLDNPQAISDMLNEARRLAIEEGRAEATTEIVAWLRRDKGDYPLVHAAECGIATEIEDGEHIATGDKGCA